MIDEKKLIRELEEAIGMFPAIYLGKKDEHNAYLDAITRALSLVKRQPKVGEWIPVEERLPEHCQVVLTSKNGCISIEQFDRKSMCWVERQRNWWWSLNMVDAWMPLPEPYVKGEDEQ